MPSSGSRACAPAAPPGRAPPPRAAGRLTGVSPRSSLTSPPDLAASDPIVAVAAPGALSPGLIATIVVVAVVVVLLIVLGVGLYLRRRRQVSFAEEQEEDAKPTKGS